MNLEDAIKTAFTIGDVIYYYVRMPFGLKNARSSFQHAIIKVFITQIWQNLEAYVDNIIFKSMAFASTTPRIDTKNKITFADTYFC